MKFDEIDVTDLLSDESFINYCKKSSAEDVAFWEMQMIEQPERRGIIEYAKEKFIQLFNVLAEADLDEQQLKLEKRLALIESNASNLNEPSDKKPSKPILPLLLKLSAAAAVLLFALFFTHQYITGQKKNVKTFAAAYGERKNIQLPDGSDVTLNAGSKIRIYENFGTSTRDVYLEGEAFFDVKHNTKFPFIVHTAAMDVKALGTAFNVKAYLNEKITETSLIRGIVQITLKENNNRVMLLYPNQKIKWENLAAANASKNLTANDIGDSTHIANSIMKKLVPTDNGNIKEIAWRENKLIFENESFNEIVPLLERWYGAEIVFQDNTLRDYRFTGIFEKEDLKTVLDFLKEAKSFHYSIETGEPLKINLSK